MLKKCKKKTENRKQKTENKQDKACFYKVTLSTEQLSSV